jgi:predicted DCC family thiol-disulfide oxidoreductase YuxK
MSDVRPENPLTVFYDGNCSVCSREMAGYRGRVSEGLLHFVDISQPDFDPTPYGRSRQEFMRLMHVMDARGRFFVGVDAFRALWRGMPGEFYPLLAALTGLPGVHLFARIGYHLFARLRHYLPSIIP